jgi:Spy/CpxP family protein refolding chaperone
LTSVVIAVGALAANDSTNAPPPMPQHPMRPMMDNILGPHIFDALALTSDQLTKYNTLNADFKKDIAKLRANNGTNAVPGAGRQELRELHHSYIEKLRPILTPDQNAKLTQWLENGPGHGRHGGGPEAGGNPPPQPPPGGNPPPQAPPPPNN